MDPNKYHFAVVVGINHYPALDSLFGAIKDADAFHNWLMKEDGGFVPERNIRRLLATDEKPKEKGATYVPTWDQIVSELNSVNTQMDALVRNNHSLFEHGRLYIFAAGHGFSAPKANAALYSPEAELQSWIYSLNLQECSKFYRKWGPFAEVVIIADCCRNEYRDASLISGGLTKCYRPPGCHTSLLVVYATERGKQSYESASNANGDQRGYLTRSILNALEDSVNEDGLVTWNDLRSGIGRNMRRLKAPQKATYFDQESDGTEVFGPPRQKPLANVTVSLRRPVEEYTDYRALAFTSDDGSVTVRECLLSTETEWVVSLPYQILRAVWLDSTDTAHLIAKLHPPWTEVFNVP